MTLDHFLAREQQIETATRRRNASLPTGVRWSGLTDEPRPERSEAEIRAAAEAKRDRAEAFKVSARGRFLAALNELEAISYAAEAEAARSAFRRGFADERFPANPGEIGNALLALNPLAGSVARAAREALAELLLEAHRRAA